MSRVDGPIVQVLVNDGQDVKAGEPLLQIDPQPLRIQVRVAEANLARDKAQLEDASAKEARGKRTPRSALHLERKNTCS